MIIITNKDTLSHVIEHATDCCLIEILGRYTPMMEEYPLAMVFIIQPGDRLDDLTRYRGREFIDWEFIELHDGGWYEAIFILSDDGFGHAVLVPKAPIIDPSLLTACEAGTA